MIVVASSCTSSRSGSPLPRSSIDATGANLILKQYYNIGFAADTPDGEVRPFEADRFMDPQALAIDLRFRNRPRIERAHLAFELHCRPVPVEARLGLVLFVRVGDAVLAALEVLELGDVGAGGEGGEGAGGFTQGRRRIRAAQARQARGLIPTPQLGRGRFRHRPSRVTR